MPNGTEVARAYVTIIPKTDGTSNEVVNSIVNPIQTGVSGAGSKAGGLFNTNLGSVISKFTIPGAVIGGLVAVGKAGFDAYEEVQSGANELIKATGATGDAAEELKDVYKDVAKSVVGDFDDIGAAVGELNTRFGLTGDDLEAASEQAMKFAQITGTDAVDSIQDITRMMNNAGISADEYGAVLDKLIVAGQQSGVDISALTQSVTANAASFQELGFSTDEAIAMLANFEVSGANASAIISGMKKGVQSWTKEGKSAKQGFQEFVTGVENGTVTAQDAMEIFGTKAGVEMFNAAQKGQLSFDDMYKAITENSTRALDQVYNDTLTASDKMSIAWKGVKEAGADLFEPLAEGASAALTNVVIPAIEGLSNGISFLVENVPIWYDTYVAPVVDTLISVFTDLPGTLSEIWDTISSTASSVWEGIKSTAETVWTGIKTAVMAPINLLKTWLSSTWTTITETATSVWEGIKSAITTPIETAKDIISGIIDAIKGFFSFEITWPNIPMPHFAITPEGWGIGDLLKGTIPHLSIDWYAKGGIFDSASIIGIGEAGREAVVPLQGSYMRPFAKAIAEEMEGGNNIVFNVNVNGTEDPETWAARFMREVNLQARMA